MVGTDQLPGQLNDAAGRSIGTVDGWHTLLGYFAGRGSGRLGIQSAAHIVIPKVEVWRAYIPDYTFGSHERTKPIVYDRVNRTKSEEQE